MNILAVVRHGDYVANGKMVEITEEGTRALGELFEKLRPYLEGKRICLLTSRASRVLESAKILGSHLGVRPQECDLLTSEMFLFSRPDEVLALIDFYPDADAIVIVSDRNCCEMVAFNYGSTRLHLSEPGFQDIQRAEAVVFECEMKRGTLSRHLQKAG